MSQHWLVCLPEDNFLISMKKGLIGLPATKAKLANKFQAGDQVVFYLTRKTPDERSERLSQLCGVAKVIGPAAMDDTEIWPKFRGEIYPYRVPMLVQEDRHRAPLKPIVGKLSFAPENEAYWALPLRQGVVAVTPADWDVLLETLQLPVCK